MANLISYILLSAVALAEEGAGHTHGAGGETEHLWPVLAVFGVLVLAGLAFNLMSKKKK